MVINSFRKDRRVNNEICRNTEFLTKAQCNESKHLENNYDKYVTNDTYYSYCVSRSIGYSFYIDAWSVVSDTNCDTYAIANIHSILTNTYATVCLNIYFVSDTYAIVNTNVYVVSNTHAIANTNFYVVSNTHLNPTDTYKGLC